MGLSIEAAIAKAGKYAARESGDSAEIVERPDGGLSVIAIDGQGSGPAAKALSAMLLARAVGLILDGVRDGAIARAVHDQLFAYRAGQVQAAMDILSVDLRSKTLLVTRNSETPVLIGRSGTYEIAPCRGEVLGLYLRTRPTIWELSIEERLQVIVITDGVSTAGARTGQEAFDFLRFAQQSLCAEMTAPALADTVLDAARARDSGRPADDMTVAAVTIMPAAALPNIRRRHASLLTS